MKLVSDGKFWLWEETEAGVTFDERVIGAQRKFNNTGKSIWGTEGCESCGACCYRFQIKTLGEEKNKQHVLCPYQKIEEISVCERQNDKPIECKNYGCWRREYKMGTPAERYAMVRIAIDILHTKQESDLIRALESAE